MPEKCKKLNDDSKEEQEFLRKLKEYGPFNGKSNEEIKEELNKAGRIGRELYLEEGDIGIGNNKIEKDIRKGNDGIFPQESVSQ